MNNLGLALLVGVVAGLLEWDIYGGIHLKAARPIITGTVMGLALGDLETGLYVGGTLELVYLGNITVGAAIPPDATCGTAIATALCIISGLDREAAVALALPVAVCAQMLQMFMWTLNGGFMHKADAYAADGELDKLCRLQIGGCIMFFFQGFIPAFLAIFLGADAVSTLVNNMPDWINTWLKVAGGMMPALGFAMLFVMMYKKKLLPYFIAGFVIAAAFGGTLISIGVLGMAAALLYVNSMDEKTEKRRGRAGN